MPTLAQVRRTAPRPQTNGDPMMALAERTDDAPRKHTGNPCSVGAFIKYLETKPPEELRVFNAMLYEWGWSQAKIHKTVCDDPDPEYWVAAQSVNRHRSGSCSCFHTPKSRRRVEP